MANAQRKPTRERNELSKKIKHRQPKKAVDDIKLIALGKECDGLFVRFLVDGPADDGLDELEAIDRAIYRRVKQIMALPAHTPAGFIVKARVVTFCNKSLWRTPKKLDYDEQLLCGLAEAALAFMGQPLPFKVVTGKTGWLSRRII